MTIFFLWNFFSLECSKGIRKMSSKSEEIHFLEKILIFLVSLFVSFFPIFLSWRFFPRKKKTWRKTWRFFTTKEKKTWRAHHPPRLQAPNSLGLKLNPTGSRVLLVKISESCPISEFSRKKKLLRFWWNFHRRPFSWFLTFSELFIYYANFY